MIYRIITVSYHLHWTIRFHEMEYSASGMLFIFMLNPIHFHLVLMKNEDEAHGMNSSIAMKCYFSSELNHEFYFKSTSQSIMWFERVFPQNKSYDCRNTINIYAKNKKSSNWVFERKLWQTINRSKTKHANLFSWNNSVWFVSSTIFINDFTAHFNTSLSFSSQKGGREISFKENIGSIIVLLLW